MKKLFTSHPHSIGETYWQHFKFAFSLGSRLGVAGIACMIHAIFPFFLEKTASNILLKAIHDFIERMPVVEERIANLSQKIEIKLRNSEI